MAAPPSDVVHQINFSVLPDAVTVAGGTLPDETMLVWLRRLQVHLRLPTSGDEPPPVRALSTFAFPDGDTAVVRRSTSGETPGRSDALALIVPTVRVPPPVALGLDRGFDWAHAAARRPFRPWDATQLEEIGDWEGRALREPALREPEQLRRALTQLLDRPDRPLTIVGCPDDHRVPLLWGLYELAAPLLRQRGVRRQWTFSTHEVDGAGSTAHRPAIVFLPDLPAGRVGRGRVVDVRVDQAASADGDRVARRQVERFRDDRNDRDDRDDRDEVTLIPVVRVPPAEKAPVGHDQRGAPVGPAGGAGRAGQEPTPPPGRAEVTAAIDRLQRARSRTELTAAMAALERVAAVPPDRAVLRGRLGAAGYAELGAQVLRLVTTDDDRQVVARRLQHAVVGPDDSDLREGDAATFAVDVLQVGPPPPLGVELLAGLDTVHGPAVVSRKITERWLEERGIHRRVVPPAASASGGADDPRPVEPRDVATGNGVSSRWAPSWPVVERLTNRSDRRRSGRSGTQPRGPATTAPGQRGVLLLLGAVVLVVVLVIAGVFARSSGEGDGPSGSAPTATSSVLPGPGQDGSLPTPLPNTAGDVVGPAPEGWSVSGTMAARDLRLRFPEAATDAKVVYLLVRPRSTEDYYYRGQCAPPAAAVWTCDELGESFASVPPDENGYEIVAVTAIGDRTETAPGLHLVRGPVDDERVVSVNVRT